MITDEVSDLASIFFDKKVVVSICKPTETTENAAQYTFVSLLKVRTLGFHFQGLKVTTQSVDLV